MPVALAERAGWRSACWTALDDVRGRLAWLGPAARRTAPACADCRRLARPGLAAAAGRRDWRWRGWSHPATVVRDAHAVPHVTAASEADAYLRWASCTGRTGCGRWSSIAWLGQGRLAEVLGEAALPVDRFMRTLGLTGVRRPPSPASMLGRRALLEAYAERRERRDRPATAERCRPSSCSCGIVPSLGGRPTALRFAEADGARPFGQLARGAAACAAGPKLRPDQLADLWPGAPAARPGDAWLGSGRPAPRFIGRGAARATAAGHRLQCLGCRRHPNRERPAAARQRPASGAAAARALVSRPSRSARPRRDRRHAARRCRSSCSAATAISPGASPTPARTRRTCSSSALDPSRPGPLPDARRQRTVHSHARDDPGSRRGASASRGARDAAWAGDLRSRPGSQRPSPGPARCWRWPGPSCRTTSGHDARRGLRARPRLGLPGASWLRPSSIAAPSRTWPLPIARRHDRHDQPGPGADPAARRRPPAGAGLDRRLRLGRHDPGARTAARSRPAERSPGQRQQPAGRRGLPAPPHGRMGGDPIGPSGSKRCWPNRARSIPIGSPTIQLDVISRPCSGLPAATCRRRRAWPRLAGRRSPRWPPGTAYARADRPEPLLFAAWYRELGNAIAADELGPPGPDYRDRAPDFCAACCHGSQGWCDRRGARRCRQLQGRWPRRRWRPRWPRSRARYGSDWRSLALGRRAPGRAGPSPVRAECRSCAIGSACLVPVGGDGTHGQRGRAPGWLAPDVPFAAVHARWLPGDLRSRGT